MAQTEKQRIVGQRLREAIDEGRSLGLTEIQLRQAFDDQLQYPDSGKEG
jgi:hypothetical protein